MITPSLYTFTLKDENDVLISNDEDVKKNNDVKYTTEEVSFEGITLIYKVGEFPRVKMVLDCVDVPSFLERTLFYVTISCNYASTGETFNISFPFGVDRATCAGRKIAYSGYMAEPAFFKVNRSYYLDDNMETAIKSLIQSDTNLKIDDDYEIKLTGKFQIVNETKMACLLKLLSGAKHRVPFAITHNKIKGVDIDKDVDVPSTDLYQLETGSYRDEYYATELESGSSEDFNVFGYFGDNIYTKESASYYKNVLSNLAILKSLKKKYLFNMDQFRPIEIGDFTKVNIRFNIAGSIIMDEAIVTYKELTFNLEGIQTNLEFSIVPKNA